MILSVNVVQRIYNILLSLKNIKILKNVYRKKAMSAISSRTGLLYEDVTIRNSCLNFDLRLPGFGKGEGSTSLLRTCVPVKGAGDGAEIVLSAIIPRYARRRRR